MKDACIWSRCAELRQAGKKSLYSQLCTRSSLMLCAMASMSPPCSDVVSPYPYLAHPHHRHTLTNAYLSFGYLRSKLLLSSHLLQDGRRLSLELREERAEVCKELVWVGCLRRVDADGPELEHCDEGFGCLLDLRLDVVGVLLCTFVELCHAAHEGVFLFTDACCCELRRSGGWWVVGSG